jgi:thiamine biosynthesis protein ThiC
MKRTPEQVAKAIDDFVSGDRNQWEWDGFISIRIDDPELEAIRQRCIAVRDEFPPDKVTDYCSPAGLEAMRKLADGLRARAA